MVLITAEKDFSNRHQLQGKANNHLKLPLHLPCTHEVLKQFGKSKIIMFYTLSSTQQLLQMSIHFKPQWEPFIWVNSCLWIENARHFRCNGKTTNHKHNLHAQPALLQCPRMHIWTQPILCPESQQELCTKTSAPLTPHWGPLPNPQESSTHFRSLPPAPLKMYQQYACYRLMQCQSSCFQHPSSSAHHWPKWFAAAQS